MQPSHPDVQSVIVNEAAFASKSTSKVHLPPFAVYAKINFPPCTVAGGASYATVQVGKAKHIDLNSDLLFINHSCEPSLVSLPSFGHQRSSSPGGKARSRNLTLASMGN
jgi:hypothetical protein